MNRLPPAQIPRPAMSPVLGVTGPGVGDLPRVEFNWGNLPGKPSSFPPAPHSHDWSSITDKPLTFAPAAHSHDWSSVTGKPSTFPPAAHDHSWESITGKPATFAPSAHNHVIEDVTGLQSALDGKQAAGSYAASGHNHDGVYSPVGHTHNYLPISGGIASGFRLLQTATPQTGVGGAGGLACYYSFQDAAHVERGWVGFGRGNNVMDILNTLGPIWINGVDVVAALGNKAALTHTHDYLPLAGGTLTGTLGVGTVSDSAFHVLSPSGTAGMRIGFAGASSNYFDADNQYFRDAGGASHISLTGGKVISNRELVVNGHDIVTYRAGGASGVVYLNADKTRYLYWDGSIYHLANGGLTVNGVDILTTLGTKVDVSSNQQVTGIKQFNSTGNTNGYNPSLQAYSSGAGNGAFMSFHRSGAYAVNMGLDSDNVLRIGGWSAPNNLMQLDMSGNVDFLGTVKSGGLGVLRHTTAGLTSGNITVSTASPSGGSNGDIWLKVPA